ncbi:Uncharacterised protein [uncultured Clostridium sp.]
MASIRKRGENSYLLVVSRGYDYQGNRLKPVQKTVHPPKGLTAKQTEKWLNEQAVLYEREVKHTPGESVDRSITLAKYIDVWLEQVAPKKLAASTLVRDKQDIRRILPALGHYKLVELNKDILRVPFPVSWTVKMKKKQKETQDILSYHTQAAGCSDKARAKASGGRQPIEECGRTGL